jgi:SAM-dependent methyltransferase
MCLSTVYISVLSRDQRSRFVARRFGAYLKDSVLDVGCFEAPLRDILGLTAYTGIDIAGKPDIELNLEKIDQLPFGNNAFDCVLCIDVLEHLDNLHAIFDELIRVSKQYIIISLPNCWCDARHRIDRGKGRLEHYGLPLENPGDRHKWFFSLTEAKQFLEGKAEKKNLKIKELFVTEKPRPSIVKLMRKLRYPGNRYKNRYTNTIWIVYDKIHPNSVVDASTLYAHPATSGSRT